MKYVLYVLTFFVISCSGTEDSMGITEEYIPFVAPENFPETTYTFSSSNIKSEQEVFELGRKLFYEPKLSSDNTISCAECHNQAFVFTHHLHALSTGVNEASGIRNTHALQNLAFQTSFNWDGVATQLFQQPIIPITAEIEMNESFENIIVKLSSDTDYVNNFQNAFKDEEINIVNILKSLGNFMAMMVSSNSKYDDYLEDETVFTEEEKEGLSLFQQKCASCHSGILFTDQSFRNNGLQVSSRLPEELGRQTATDNIEDYYKFKVPSLRNVTKSGPYMHDGRISSIRGVLDYYSTDVVATSNLDPLLNNNGVLGIPLTEEEKDKLEAFLETLTDDEFLNDERFADPN